MRVSFLDLLELVNCMRSLRSKPVDFIFLSIVQTSLAMNGIRNTVSAVGEIARELGTQVALQISAETATGSLRNFTDLEEKYADLNRQRLLLRTLRYDSESEV